MKWTVTQKAFELPNYRTLRNNGRVKKISYRSYVLRIVFPDCHRKSQYLHSLQSVKGLFFLFLLLAIYHSLIASDRRSGRLMMLSVNKSRWLFSFFFWMPLKIIKMNDSSFEEWIFAGPMMTFEATLQRGLLDSFKKPVFH